MGLRPKRRIRLATVIQTRFEQRRGKPIKFSEDYLIYEAGLSKTANSNPRQAKKRLREDLEELIKEKIIDKYEERNGLYTIFPPFKVGDEK